MKIKIIFDKSLSVRTGVRDVELSYDKCVKVREILDDLCKIFNNLDKTSLLVFKDDKLLTLEDYICTDSIIEITESVLGG